MEFKKSKNTTQIFKKYLKIIGFPRVPCGLVDPCGPVDPCGTTQCFGPAMHNQAWLGPGSVSYTHLTLPTILLV